MVAVVTGSRGFIGSHLVDALRRGGHEGRPLVVRADHAVDASVLDGADVVFHLAGLTSSHSEAELHRANVDTTRALLSAIPSQPRFVFVSSQAAAGPARSIDQPVRETDAPNPVEAYGRSKLAAEDVVIGSSDVDM